MDVGAAGWSDRGTNDDRGPQEERFAAQNQEGRHGCFAYRPCPCLDRRTGPHRPTRCAGRSRRQRRSHLRGPRAARTNRERPGLRRALAACRTDMIGPAPPDQALKAVEATVQWAASWPASGARVEGLAEALDVRRAPVSRYPYHLAYWVAGDEIHVHVDRRMGPAAGSLYKTRGSRGYIIADIVAST